MALILAMGTTHKQCITEFVVWYRYPLGFNITPLIKNTNHDLLSFLEQRNYIFVSLPYRPGPNHIFENVPETISKVQCQIDTSFF